MNFEGSYIYRKEVDWSLLHEGLTIPLRHLVAFKSLLDGYPLGLGRNVTMLLDGASYSAILVNQKFDREKFSRPQT
jgi:5-methylcytosine-specific restriction protein A